MFMSFVLVSSEPLLVLCPYSETYSQTYPQTYSLPLRSTSPGPLGIPPPCEKFHSISLLCVFPGWQNLTCSRHHHVSNQAEKCTFSAEDVDPARSTGSGTPYPCNGSSCAEPSTGKPDRISLEEMDNDVRRWGKTEAHCWMRAAAGTITAPHLQAPGLCPSNPIQCRVHFSFLIPFIWGLY